MRSVYLASLGLVSLVLSVPAYVHHSGAMFDRTKQVTITGTISEFVWTNPHASFRVDVVGPDGKVASWPVEMNGPSNLIHEGWKRTTLKPGDKVTVVVNPLRDGRPGGWYISITLADGKTLGGGSPPAGGEPAEKSNP